MTHATASGEGGRVRGRVGFSLVWGGKGFGGEGGAKGLGGREKVWGGGGGSFWPVASTSTQRYLGLPLDL